MFNLNTNLGTKHYPPGQRVLFWALYFALVAELRVGGEMSGVM